MTFLVRWLHVAGVSFLLGGAILVALLFLWPARIRLDLRSLLRVAQAYEWGFWGAMGLVVMTGVGNLGAFGEGLPGPKTVWGERLSVKLVLVLVLFGFSMLRTLLVVVSHLNSTGEARQTSTGSRTLAGLYGATVVILAAVVGLATALAHF